MRKRFGSALRIGLSTTGAAVVHTSGWLQMRSAIVAETGDAKEAELSFPAGGVQQLGRLLKDAHCSRLPARIVLDDGLVRCWMVTPPRNAQSLADCQAAARARFQILFGDALAGWHMAADWDARKPFMACAIPQGLLAALQQLARERSLVLVEVAPQFVIAWNRWRAALQADAWFGVLHRQVLTFAVLTEHGINMTRALALPEEALLNQLLVPEMLAREALRLNVPMPTGIRLCGQIPAHWVMQKTGGMNFVRLDRLRPGPAALSAEAELAFTGMNP